MDDLTSEDRTRIGAFEMDTSSPIAPFVAKLERRMQLSCKARNALLSLPVSLLYFAERQTVIEQNAPTNRCLFVSAGVITRQRRIEGRRRILGLGLPGDAIDIQSLWFDRHDQSVVSHGQTMLCAVEHVDIKRLCGSYPHVANALYNDALVDASIAREWMLNIGHRRAEFRLGHFLLETAARLEADGRLFPLCVFELPLTQSELASALGLSLVHLNKSLRALRDHGYIKTEGRRVTLVDRAALQQATGFDAVYLHIATAPKVPLAPYVDDTMMPAEHHASPTVNGAPIGA